MCSLEARAYHFGLPPSNLARLSRFRHPDRLLVGGACEPTNVGIHTGEDTLSIAASSVADEPLSSDFNGVLGLALPANSLIAQKLPPTTSDTPDGAIFSSNLFSITPISTAPGARFLSLALERPGSDNIRSVLGVGRHPADIVPDPSKIEYATVVATSSNGPLWWQANIEGINVYVNGVRKPVTVSSTSARGPTAILDSGAPLIVATRSIANGIYGALGVSPAADGNYYIPCSTPINMTIQLDNRMEIPIHPLDLTYYPPDDASSETCIGAIQTPEQLNFDFSAADMILGVPFLRNTYTVMAFDPPAADGTFPTNSGDSNAIEQVRPRLGLLNLTDPAVAADEFHQVRVLKQPLQKSNTTAQPPAPSHGLSAGIIALISLLGFFGMCFVLFGARWAYMKRRYARQRRAAAGAGAYGPGDSKDDYTLNELGYHLSPMHTKSSSGPSEDELRQKRFEAYKRRQMESTYTDDTGITFIDANLRESKGFVPDEFGAFPQAGTPDTLVQTPHSPTRGYFDSWRDTLVDGTLADGDGALLSPPPRSARRSDLSLSPRSMHHRTLSGGPGAEAPLLGHARTGSEAAAAAQQQDARNSIDIVDRGLDSPRSMAGVGTASRSRRVSGMSPSPLGEFPPEVREGSRRSPERARLSLPVPPPALVPEPEPESALETTRNASRTSVQGHER
ncbi:aspartic peptidase domain-containing protein [Daedaleopsis nitida]|nr:aspartic peptidase domain-containing protein [Daedaleopsis nitida]